MIKQYLIRRKWRILRAKAIARLLKKYKVYCNKAKNSTFYPPCYHFVIEQMTPIEAYATVRLLLSEDNFYYDWDSILRLIDKSNEKKGVIIDNTPKE